MSLKSYPKYKDSGIEWIGEIPVSWSVDKFRYVFTESDEVNGPSPVGEMLSISGYRGVETKHYDDENQKRSESQLESYRVVRKGQLAVNTMWLNHAGLGVSQLVGHVSPAYRSYWIRPDMNHRYVHHLMRSSTYVDGYTALLSGIRPNSLQMSRPDLMAFPILVPPVEEQRAIADFLDRETSEIDAFIADQERLITLLEERRAATITHAVTKGLDPNAPMKDSGIDWLGYVPRHWQIARVKNSIQEAKNGVWGLEPDGSGLDLRCVRVADFDRPRLSIHDRNATLRKIPLNEQKGRILSKGDLLLEKSGGGEKSPVGFVVRYDRDEPAVCSNFVSRLVLRPGMDSQFWTYLHSMLYSRRLTQRSIKQTTGIQNLDQASYFNELVAFPTHKEQCAIAESLDREMAELDAAVSDAREAIALSRERRAALISAAVTGHLDVSEAQSRRSAGEVLEDEVRV